jgi:hypothetical protein
LFFIQFSVFAKDKSSDDKKLSNSKEAFPKLQTSHSENMSIYKYHSQKEKNRLMTNEMKGYASAYLYGNPKLSEEIILTKTENCMKNKCNIM